MTILDILLIIFVFSCIGYVYEVILHYITTHKFIHSGILQGPYCFIYGFGAAILTVFNISPISMFFVGMVNCFLLELIVSYMVDALHLKRWDYSHFPYTLQGRTCLYSVVFFGFVSVLYSALLKQPILNLLSLIPPGLKLFLIIIIDIILVFDIAYTYLRTTKH